MIPVLDHGYVKLVNSWGSDEVIIESARMSTGKGFKGWGTEESPGDERLLAYLWRSKHHSPFEMAGLSIEVKAPIFVFREWHRHRTQSYNEMSARYIKLPNENYLPTVERIMEGISSQGANKQAAGNGKIPDRYDVRGWVNRAHDFYKMAEYLYESGIDLGIPREVARVVVPVARYSAMRASANLRNWLGFLSLRMAPDAQWEIRQYADAVETLVRERFPRTRELFSDR